LEKNNIKTSQERNKPHHFPREITILMREHTGEMEGQCKGRQQKGEDKEAEHAKPHLTGSLKIKKVWLVSVVMWQVPRDEEVKHTKSP